MLASGSHHSPGEVDQAVDQHRNFGNGWIHPVEQA